MESHTTESRTTETRTHHATLATTPAPRYKHPRCGDAESRSVD